MSGQKSAVEALSAIAKDCFYAARDGGRTMHEAADETAAAILAAGWRPPVADQTPDVEALAGAADVSTEAPGRLYAPPALSVDQQIGICPSCLGERVLTIRGKGTIPCPECAAEREARR